MENNNIDVKLLKIPVKILMETLVGLYEMGADYIDIFGINNIEQDTIAISVRREYMCPDYEEDQEYDEDGEEINEEDIIKNFNIKLSDEDLNQLL